MCEEHTQKSEVAQLLSQIRAEYEAAQRGLNGLAYGVSQHEFITAKMERMGQCQERLAELVGEMPATAMIVAQLEVISDPPEESVL